MNNDIKIKAGEYAVGDKGKVISSVGVGSCMVICVYDLNSGWGGMAHSMLPNREYSSADYSAQNGQNKEIEVISKSPKYVDEAVDLLISRILNKGAKIKNIKAKIVGGASLFKSLSNESSGMGKKNIDMVKVKLKEKNIPIINEDVGGSIGRMVEFIVADGCVIVSTKTVL